MAALTPSKLAKLAALVAETKAKIPSERRDPKRSRASIESRRIIRANEKQKKFMKVLAILDFEREYSTYSAMDAHIKGAKDERERFVAKYGENPANSELTVAVHMCRAQCIRRLSEVD